MPGPDDVPISVTGAPVLDPATGQLVDSRTGLPIASAQAPQLASSQAPPAAPAGPPPSIPNTEGWTPPPAQPSPQGGAQSSDLQLGKGGAVQNPGDFTPGQLTDLLHAGKITFGNYQAAIQQAAPPANNAGDQAAMAADANAHANDGRYGSKGLPQPKQEASATPAAPSGPVGNIVTRQPPPGAGAAGPNPYAQLPLGIQGAVGGVRQVGLSGADKGLLSAEDAREKARQDSLNAATEQARAIQDDLTKHGQAVIDESKAAKDKAEAEAEQDKADRAAIAQRYHDNQTRIESQLAQMQAQGIDPNRYYQNMSTPQKIAAGFAVAMGAVGAGPLGPHGTRGTNDALKIIQQAQQDDLDSQKTDLQNRLAIMGKRMDLNREGFSQDMALNNAAAESRQAMHAVTQNYISRLASQYATTDEQKAKVAQIQQQLDNDNYTALGNHQNIEFQTRKGAEKLVATGPAADPRLKEWNSYRHELAVAHPELSGDQLDAKTADYFHQAPVPGVPVPTIKPKGGGNNARVARTMAEYSANKKALDDLRAYASKPVIYGEDQGKVDALVQRLHNAGMDVPAGFTARLFGKTGGNVAANRALVNEQINTLQNTMANGMGGGTEEPDDDLAEAP